MLLPETTLVGQSLHHPTDLIRQFTQDVHLGHLSPIPGGSSLVHRYFITSGEESPFLLDLTTTIDNKPAIFTDMRAFMTDAKTVKRIAYRDYLLRDIHSQLLSLWMDPHKRDDFLTNMAFAGTVLVASIVNRLTHIYRLDGAEQVMVSLIIAQWYGQQLRDKDEYSETEALRDMGMYSGIPIDKLSSQLVNISMLEKITSLNQLVTAIKDKLASPKTANFSLASFLVSVKPLVFVYRSDIIIPLAMEFPPMFIALTRLAMVDRSMRKSYLFTAAQNQMTRQKQLTTTFETYLNQHLVESQYE